MLKKLLIIIIFFIYINVNAEEISKIEISGNNRISDETIIVYGEIQIGKEYNDGDLNDILKKIYSTDFFEKIELSLKNNILKIDVVEYKTINSVDIKGENSNSVKNLILEKLSLKQKKSFISNVLNEDVALIKKIYASQGYNFVKVNPQIQEFSQNRINLFFLVEKGEKTFIKKINFIGDKKIRDYRLREIIASEEKKFWKILSKNTYLNKSNIELDIRLLENYYKSLGYYDVQILSNNAELTTENLTELTYTINAGKRFQIKKITTNLDPVVEKKIFEPLERLYTDLVGQYYSPFKVKKILDEVDVLIVNNDLQFIEHSVNEILDNNSIEIVINIYEGKKETVEKINIYGNTVTEESVVRSELIIDEGDPFNGLKLEKSIARINARNIFGDVRYKILDGEKKENKIIEISVEEKPTGEISAGAGIGTNGGSFAFNISENNYLGKGINLSTNLELSSEVFTGGVSLVDPNYNNSGNELSVFLQNVKSDKPDSGYKNNVITTGVGTKFEQYRDIYFSPSLNFSYDTLKVDSSASEALKKQKGDFSDLSFNYAILNDKRDRVFGPTEGYITSFSQSLPIYSDAPYIRNSFSSSKYYSFNKDIIGAIKIYGSAINGLNNKDVRLSKRLNLSSSRLRGFESGKIGPKDGNDYVGGNYAAAVNFEISLPNLLPENTNADIQTFLDFGNVWNVDYSNSIQSSNKIRSSTGVSTNWNSPVGPLSFVFSKNLLKASTDVTESFNFRLGTTF